MRQEGHKQEGHLVEMWHAKCILLYSSASAHCVCVVVRILGVSLCRCSFVCVRHSIFYVCVTFCDLDVTMRRHYK